MRPIRFPQTQAVHYAMVGGLDLESPRITIDHGFCFDAQNYRPLAIGGYGRKNGYERFNGRPSPTSASYWTLPATITGTVTTAATLTGVTSAATGRVLGTASGLIVLGRVTGTFVSGEALQISAVTVATSTATAVQGGATTPSDDADYRLLAANDYRADILAPVGSGTPRGGFVLNDICYCFIDNAGATAGLMYKQSATGWTQVALGRELLFINRTGTVTITIAAPGVVTWTGHGLAAGQGIQLSTTGALPTGLTAGVTYYLIAAGLTANTFELSATVGGTAITTSGSQSGVHTAVLVTATGFAVGDTVTGATSGATAVVKAVLLRTGTWFISPVGSMVFSTVTGAFTSGEALQNGGVTQAQANGADTAITRQTGGHVEVVVGNFTGSATTNKAYGADGVNVGFEFDGTTYVPIHTGQTTDTPTHVAVHKLHLVFAVASSLQISGTNQPYSHTVLTGASEIGMGDVITALVTQSGTSAGASLAVFTTGHTSILYGSSSLDFSLVPSVYQTGYQPYTVQAAGNNTYGLTLRGIQSLQTTLGYGDFSFSAESLLIQSLLDSKSGLACASITLKALNEYRLFFTDGTAIVMGLSGPKSTASIYGMPTRDNITGMMLLNYGIPVRCIWNETLSTGEEVTYFGSDDGFVYRDDIGTSFDGDAIEAWIRPVFNNVNSPRLLKQFRRAIFEANCNGYASINISYDLGYATPDVEGTAVQQDQSLTGAGGYWEQFTWEQFTWDAPVVQEPQISIDGTEKNISFLVYSNRAQDDSHSIEGVSLLFTPRRLVR